jgi:alkylhydroperoxidase/carboxymuconolactone decarboxylase family protein YurZ
MDRARRDEAERPAAPRDQGAAAPDDASGNGSGAAGPSILARIRAKRGYLLPFHELLARHAPAVLERYDDYYTQVWLEQNVLDARTKELVAIGIHAAVLEREGLEIHLRRAVAAGATEAEITEAMTLAGIPAGMYAVVVAADVWQRVRSSTGYSWERPAGGE